MSEYEYHVPLLVWYSDEYAAAHLDKTQVMRSNRFTPVTSDVVFYSLLDMADIEEVVDSTRSICSPALMVYDSVYVLTGSGDKELIQLR